MKQFVINVEDGALPDEFIPKSIVKKPGVGDWVMCPTGPRIMTAELDPERFGLVVVLEKQADYSTPTKEDFIAALNDNPRLARFCNEKSERNPAWHRGFLVSSNPIRRTFIDQNGNEWKRCEVQR